MNDEELFRLATKAGYNYKKVFGAFPRKIGIEERRIRSFRRHEILFPMLPPPPTLKSMLEEAPLTAPYATIHHCRLEPIEGIDIKPDEVYVLFGFDELRAISGETIACYAENEIKLDPLIYLSSPMWD